MRAFILRNEPGAGTAQTWYWCDTDSKEDAIASAKRVLPTTDPGNYAIVIWGAERILLSVSIEVKVVSSQYKQ